MSADFKATNVYMALSSVSPDAEKAVSQRCEEDFDKNAKGAEGSFDQLNDEFTYTELDFETKSRNIQSLFRINLSGKNIGDFSKNYLAQYGTLADQGYQYYYPNITDMVYAEERLKGSRIYNFYIPIQLTDENGNSTGNDTFITEIFGEDVIDYSAYPDQGGNYALAHLEYDPSLLTTNDLDDLQMILDRMPGFVGHPNPRGEHVAAVKGPMFGNLYDFAKEQIATYSKSTKTLHVAAKEAGVLISPRNNTMAPSAIDTVPFDDIVEYFNMMHTQGEPGFEDASLLDVLLGYQNEKGAIDFLDLNALTKTAHELEPDEKLNVYDRILLHYNTEVQASTHNIKFNGVPYQLTATVDKVTGRVTMQIQNEANAEAYYEESLDYVTDRNSGEIRYEVVESKQLKFTDTITGSYDNPAQRQTTVVYPDEPETQYEVDDANFPSFAIRKVVDSYIDYLKEVDPEAAEIVAAMQWN